MTNAEKCARYKAKHPEKFTASARKEERQKYWKKDKGSENYLERQERYKDSEKYINATLKYRYGITLNDKKNMFKSQRGKCGVCCKSLPKDLSRCFVDHSHDTRKVRSLTHRRCNLLLGFEEKTPGVMKACLKYLRTYGKKTRGHCRKARRHKSQRRWVFP